jgi:hypothetical protein
MTLPAVASNKPVKNDKTAHFTRFLTFSKSDFFVTVPETLKNHIRVLKIVQEQNPRVVAHSVSPPFSVPSKTVS